MSRSGDRREILHGPLFYGVAFVVLTLIFWRHSPVGMVALMILCGGDGLADIVGNRIGGVHLPWSQKKTVSGSLTMLLGGFLFAILITWVFVGQGYFDGRMTDYVLPIAIISLVCALIESLPFSDIDNITVPVTAVLLGLLLF
jgi:phytol kinase